MNSELQNLPYCFTPEILSDKFQNVVFDIPIYQRLFAWREEQIKELMDDLLEASSKGGNYYIGILTIAVNNKHLELIDGQQRMTVTTLMAIAFKELEPEKCAYWNKFLKDGERLKFSARDEDTSYLSARANGKAGAYMNHQMESAIDVIKAWCQEKKVDVVEFSDYVWRNLTLFCSYLPDNYVRNPIELNRYFEAMNSTGRQLKQHEILLVNLVSGHKNSVALSILWQEIADTQKRLVANCDGSSDEVAQARNEYIWRLNDTHSIFTEKDGNEVIFETIEAVKPANIDISNSTSSDSSKEMLISFEELLLMALALTPGVKVTHPRQFYKPEHLIARFADAKLKEKGLIDTFFETLYKCRLLMDYKIVWQETGGDFDYQIVTEDPEHRLEKFQSMLYVAHQNDFYRWLPSYMQWLIDNPGSDTETELGQLKHIDHDLHGIVPSVDQLNYHKVDRYWFWRLDYELWDHRNDKDGWLKDNPTLKEVVNRYVFRVNRSIEHLHPQTPTDDKSEVWDYEDLNCFGNLAMISSAFNSLQSNESVGVKMERIHHQKETSQLQSLKMLHMWMTYRDGETWTPKKAKIHERLMYSFLESL